MPVCRYFQQGRCRFGEKCWFEHPGYFPGALPSETHWVSPTYAAEIQRFQQARPQNIFNQTSFSFRNASNDNFSHDDVDQYENFNNFENDPYHYEREKDHRTTKSDSSKFSSLSSNEAGNKRDSEIISLKMDIICWESKNIWPFSCYTHFKKRDACFPGFVDVSPEELRYKAYEAEQKDDFQSYVKAVAAAMQDIKTKWNVLKESTTDYIESIGPEYNFNLTYPDSVKSLICCSEKGTNSVDNRRTENQFFSKQPSSFSGDFNLGHQYTVQPSSSSSASTFRFVMPSDEEMKTETSIFGSSSGFGGRTPFKQLSSSSGHSSLSPLVPTFSPSSSLAPKNVTKAFDKPGVKSSNYTPLEDLTEQENIQFSSEVFTIGKIPSRPPPMEMCF